MSEVERLLSLYEGDDYALAEAKALIAAVREERDREWLAEMNLEPLTRVGQNQALESIAGIMGYESDGTTWRKKAQP